MKEKLTRLVSTLVKISIKSKQRKKIVPIVLSGLESLIIHFAKKKIFLKISKKFKISEQSGNLKQAYKQRIVGCLLEF
jgi:hypothetical protein